MDIPVLGPFKMTFDQTVAPGFLKAEEKIEAERFYAGWLMNGEPGEIMSDGTEKILKYEKVHSMKDMNELKRRLGEDRRFFAYFHPALEDEPLIFVEIALTKGLGNSIQELTRPSNQKIKNT